MQVSNNFALPTSDAQRELEELLCCNKAADNIPVFSVKSAGATVTLSSDWDVSPVDVFLGLSQAINRGDRQSIDLKVRYDYCRLSFLMKYVRCYCIS